MRKVDKQRQKWYDERRPVNWQKEVLLMLHFKENL